MHATRERPMKVYIQAHHIITFFAHLTSIHHTLRSSNTISGIYKAASTLPAPTATCPAALVTWTGGEVAVEVALEDGTAVGRMATDGSAWVVYAMLEDSAVVDDGA